eukprot:CAMPEP_0179344866 /NCGR_PEP_ID=MMETSP0797-20121207/71735_1 /TAXON_ID=47934 /ORGANISM="Dinophysis acuminata, Strain DAEP01" /LENGTH=51 /DNA_ID=CAMNT_0021059309 /DNA_START=48 /DNA_END=201 /DNA_ORIENTATION=-
MAAATTSRYSVPPTDCQDRLLAGSKATPRMNWHTATDATTAQPRPAAPPPA